MHVHPKNDARFITMEKMITHDNAKKNYAEVDYRHMPSH